jgi:[acyl-carrier-protein] S-malonyltransferase
MTRQTAVVVFPGRGVYGKDELGYVQRHHGGKQGWLSGLDDWRKARGREAITALDSRSSYLARDHASSENASAIIYACALADFADIDRERFDIVAITGNSLGWYLALDGAGALKEGAAIGVVDEMGQLMAREGRGGQIVTSLIDEQWQFSSRKRQFIEHCLQRVRSDGGLAEWSIELGGTAVLGGDEKGLTLLEAVLPSEPPFPFRLARHSAFHTSLLSHIPPLARAALDSELFEQPKTPLIDGRGAIWRSGASDLDALYAYTFGHQIERPYHFTAAIRTALREFAPDVFILTGPGSNLGGAIAQSIIAEGLWPFKDKQSFIDQQKGEAPRLLAMGMEAQRRKVTGR